MLALLFLAAARDESREAVLVTGKPFRAVLVSVDPAWQVVLRHEGNDQPTAEEPAAEAPAGEKTTAEKVTDKPAAEKLTDEKPAEDKPADETAAAKSPIEETLAPGELVRWGTPVDPPRQPLVFLADDGVLVAAAANEVGKVVPATLLVADDKLLIGRSRFGPVAVPLEFVRGVMFHPPADLRERDRLAARITGAASTGQPRRDSDLLVLENGDEVSGRFVSLNSTRVALEAAVGKVEVPLAKLAAIVFNPALSAPVRRSGPAATVGYDDGSRFTARQLTLDGEEARAVPLVLAPGKDWPSDAVWIAPPNALVFLQPTGGKVTYLSDLPVDGYKHMPYLSLEWPYRLDRSVTGTQLRAHDRLYLKGLGMHSASRITFKLDQPYRRFEADLAVDDSAAGRGSVVFRVYVDSEQRYESPMVRGGDAPLPISVDVSGGKRLSLIVDFAERGDELDHADWLDARLVE